MSAYIWGAVIGSGTTLAGAALATIRDLKLRATEARHRRHERLQAAMSAYLAALDSVLYELADQPAPARRTKIDRALDRAIARTGTHVVIHIVARLLTRLTYGKRPSELSDRLFDAASDLRLIAPPAALALMQEAEEQLNDWSAADEAWRVEWHAVRDRVRDGFREILSGAELG